MLTVPAVQIAERLSNDTIRSFLAQLGLQRLDEWYQNLSLDFDPLDQRYVHAAAPFDLLVGNVGHIFAGGCFLAEPQVTT